MKSTSHKGKNKKENWLVGLYYNNETVFKITVPGAETCAVLLFMQAHMASLQSNLFWVILVVVLSLILTFKMIVNVFQWTGSVVRFEAYDIAEAKKAHDNVASKVQ